jgi:Endonuclease-reverse transcriptase
VACRLSVPEPVTLCSIYLPPTSSWNYTGLLSLISSLPSPVILMGDFNSHSTLWGCRTTNLKGLEMETFLLQSNVCLLNNKCPTYLHPATGSLSSLDLALCDPSLYTNFNWSIYNDLCGSDHYPTILTKPVAIAVQDQKRWKLAKADWAVYQDLCSSSLNPTAQTGSNDKFKSFTDKITEIAEKTIPKTTGKCNARDPGSLKTASQL